jgi:Tol biopolymer transport system component
LNAERWRQVEDLFHSVSELPEAERGAHLDRACGGDAELRREVESLLTARNGTLIDGGIARAAAHVIRPRGQWQGRTLGAYELGQLIGVGGMGEVYLARDTKLGREVAIKMLPEALTAGIDRRSRFEREARILATLNHPNIAAIYEVEEAGDVRALVLELVDGPTLAERLEASSGPRARGLAIDEALDIARQIARACEAAHRKGIIHRDLKPSNIKIAKDGTVKVLDFGIAKFEDAAAPAPTRSGAPTTGEGAILGTVAYMSPEQARGFAVDRRTDIWAFGCVLYEMLTGSRSFPGDTSADIVGAIINLDPDWSLLPPATPERVRNLLRRCLAKGPERRYHDMADVRLELDESLDPSAPARRRLPALVGWVAAAIVVVAAGALLWTERPPSNAGRRGPARVSIELPPDVAVYAIGRGSSVTLSPDGQRIVYVAVNGAGTRLMSRPLDAQESTPIAGTDNATNPFFSPDGRWIGFWSTRTLRKVPAAGGVVMTVVEGASFLGTSWGTDDTIVYSTDPGSELWRVSAEGGGPRRVTVKARNGDIHSWPQLLPGNRSLLYTVWNNTGFEGARIVVQPLAGGDPKVLVERGSYGRVVVDRDAAYLVFARVEGLFAAPFDVRFEQLTGAAFPVQDRVLTNMSGGAHFAVSTDGVLAFVPGTLYEADKTLLWVARDGTTTELPKMPGIGFQYRLSPDGRRIARPGAGGGGRDLWIDDLSGQSASIRLTFGEVTNTPTWTPDGRSVIYTAEDGNLFLRAADGTGEPRQLTTGPHQKEPGSVTPDGTLVYHELDPKNGFDIWRLSLTGSPEPVAVVRTPRNEGAPKTSPDGRFVAYQSNISGRPEVYVASFPSGDNRVRVSQEGGLSALWSRDGGEVYYRGPQSHGEGQMMAAAIGVVNGAPRAGPPVVLFPGPFQGSGDVGPDGRFFLVKQTTRESSTRVIQLVFDWFEDLRQKVAAR